MAPPDRTPADRPTPAAAGADRDANAEVSVELLEQILTRLHRGDAPVEGAGGSPGESSRSDASSAPALPVRSRKPQSEGSGR